MDFTSYDDLRNMLDQEGNFSLLKGNELSVRPSMYKFDGSNSRDSVYRNNL